MHASDRRSNPLSYLLILVIMNNTLNAYYINGLIPDESQNKYGNANAWRYCCQVFDLLTVAAVSKPSFLNSRSERFIVKNSHIRQNLW